jgi:hypothetical protein
MGIQLLDHSILTTDENFSSFADNGLYNYCYENKI